MGRAAKFRGHCQACGKLHKLPGGVLSKHGYRVVWNSFWNVCPGADHVPFEESKDLCEALILDVEESIVLLERNIAAVPNEDFITLSARIKEGYKRRTVTKTYKLSEVEWGRVPHAGSGFIKEENGLLYSFHSYGAYDEEGMLAEYRKQKIYGFESQIAQAKRYIEWMAGRIKNWKPEPLVPLEEEEPQAERKWFAKRTDAYVEERRLKEAGHKVRVRRDPNYGMGATVYDYGPA